MQLLTNTYLQNGKYRIIRVLGQGGFDIVKLKTRFLKESKNISKLNNSGIIMKLKKIIAILFFISSYSISMAQFGATTGPGTGLPYDENKEAIDALHKGNYSKAKAIWEKYEEKDIWAQNHLGFLYETIQDYPNAVSYYTKSANQGNTHAMLNLGRLYYTGKGINKDYSEALKWYKKSALLDSGIAMYNLGYLYLKGKGTAKDEAMALQWYKAAALKGHEGAQKAVDILSKKRYWLIF